jgi:hypothetical protein
VSKLEDNTSPVEVWLTKKDIAVGAVIYADDVVLWQDDTDSISMRGAQREMTAWLISAGYEPLDRWRVEYTNGGGEYDVAMETVRTFRPKKEPKQASQPARRAREQGSAGE